MTVNIVNRRLKKIYTVHAIPFEVDYDAKITTVSDSITVNKPTTNVWPCNLLMYLSPRVPEIFLVVTTFFALMLPVCPVSCVVG